MRIETFLARNDGVITRDEAKACGLSDDAIDRRVRSGRWRPVHRGVYLDIAWPWTARARVRALAGWAGPRGTLTGITAAWWCDLGVRDPRPMTVALPPGQHRRPPTTAIAAQRLLLPVDRARHLGLAVTARPLTVLDAAVMLGPVDGMTFLDRALQRHVSFVELAATQSRTLGRRGSTESGRMLALVADRTASEAERRTVALLRSAGFLGWRLNLEVTVTSYGRALLDLAFPDVKLAVEVDGWAWHSDAERFRADRRRKAALVADGWTVLELTWTDLVSRPAGVVEDLRRTLDRLVARQ